MRWMLRTGIVLFVLNLSMAAQGNITPELLQQLNSAAAEGTAVEATVYLEDRVDIDALYHQFEAQQATQQERVYTIITSLQNKAAETQEEVLSFLATFSAAEVPYYEGFWISNVIYIDAQPAVILALDAATGISRIDVRTLPVNLTPINTYPANPVPNSSEPGLRAIKADKMWAAGYTGEGVLVMNLDTGVDLNHPALNTTWHGHDVPASQAWFGPGTNPTDCGGHGSHTMGTVIGLDPATSDTIGAAFNARWIAAGAIDCAGNNMVAAFEWAINPDDDIETTDDMPHVINNSWRWPLFPTNCNSEYEDAIMALEAAGVAVIFAAGNEGPGSQSIGDPSHLNNTELIVFAVGAVNGNIDGFPIASFSSRGPTICVGEGNQIKPEVSAPGVFVRSSTGGGYQSWDGTSMATPHVVGAFALLKSAVPGATAQEIKQALYETAIDHGNEGEDNSYGMGVIDVWAAFQSFGAPSSPTALSVYSDYSTPDQMALSWTDPTTFVNGDSLGADAISLFITRDGVLVDSLAGGIGQYTDMGLIDGLEYSYGVFARIDSSGFVSGSIAGSWIAGGSPVPSAVQSFNLGGGESEIVLSWSNPAANIDGTPMDDLAGINLYRNGEFETFFERSSMDTARADSQVYTLPVPGLYNWFIRVVDNEDPANESDASITLGTPLNLPLFDLFELEGEPNPGVWINSNADVNENAVDPPSGTLSLNLNGKPDGEDYVDLKPMDLGSTADADILLKYYYQPQGSGDKPETQDSLRVYLKNSLEQWILVRAYPGSELQPFAEELVNISSEDAGGGTFLHSQFQVRFRSTGGAGTFANDNWFVDDISIFEDTGVGIGDISTIPSEFNLEQNYPNPFNPSTTLRYQLPLRSDVSLAVYNMLGQKVRALVSRTQAAGTYSVLWDGKNELGEDVASGIYLSIFSATDNSGSQIYKRSNKMILLK